MLNSLHSVNLCPEVQSSMKSCSQKPRKGKTNPQWFHHCQRQLSSLSTIRTPGIVGMTNVILKLFQCKIIFLIYSEQFSTKIYSELWSMYSVPWWLSNIIKTALSCSGGRGWLLVTIANVEYTFLLIYEAAFISSSTFYLVIPKTPVFLLRIPRSKSLDP